MDEDLDSAAWRELQDRIDLMTPYAVRVAVTLGLPDLISGGATTPAALAAAARADAGALERLLRYLACRGLFRAGPDGYGLTPLSRLLTAGHPLGMHGWLRLDGAAGRMDAAVPGLLDAVRTGAAAYPARHGHGLWDDLASDPALAADFDALMTAHSAWLAPAVAAAGDWRPGEHVVDVGGGTGTLLAAILRTDASLRGTIVDLPATIAAAAPLLAAQALDGRCELVAGSFFDPLPAGAGTYVLANILHDWPDDDALAILRRAAAAAGPRGRVLVVERPLDGPAGEREMTGMDLRMLVVFGSRERTAAQLESLARGAGLRVRATRPTDTGYTLFECVSAAHASAPAAA
jgi:2,7-dihydroxy-5-methyl-1-naphthoate 7-O-methyltransferase